MATMGKTRIEVNKNKNESNANFVRRFSRSVRESGLIPKAKSGRYVKKSDSKLRKKQSALHKIKKRKEYEKLKKLGKI